MKVSKHYRFTWKIVAILLGSAIVLPVGRADGNRTKVTPRQVAMATPVSEIESPNQPVGRALAMIEQVQTTELGHHVQVRIVASGALSCNPFRLAEPSRLVLDCTGAHVQVRSTPLRVDLDPVRSVRMGQFKPDVARVVVELKGQPEYVIRPEGKSVIVTFDSDISQPSAAESSTQGLQSPPRQASQQHELTPTAVLAVTANSPVAKRAETTAANPASSDMPPSDKSASTEAAKNAPAGLPPGPADVATTVAEPDSPLDKFKSASANDEYVIGAQDVLAIDVWREPELSRTVPVRPDGKISLPLVGEINVNGLTPHVLEARLTEELDSYVRKPKVTVIVQEANSHKFYIMGQVEKPGTYPLTTHVAILDALAMAGGFRDFAKMNQIYLLRLLPDGSRKRIFFDYKSAVNGKDDFRDTEIQTGDTLVVP